MNTSLLKFIGHKFFYDHNFKSKALGHNRSHLLCGTKQTVGHNGDGSRSTYYINFILASIVIILLKDIIYAGIILYIPTNYLHPNWRVEPKVS